MWPLPCPLYLQTPRALFCSIKLPFQQQPETGTFSAAPREFQGGAIFIGCFIGTKRSLVTSPRPFTTAAKIFLQHEIILLERSLTQHHLRLESLHGQQGHFTTFKFFYSCGHQGNNLNCRRVAKSFTVEALLLMQQQLHKSLT